MTRILPALLILFALSAYGQKEDYVWVLGNSNLPPDSFFSASVIDFNFQPPKIEIKYHFFPVGSTKVDISDSNGVLQCYSNGIHLYSAQNEIVENGEGFQSPSSYPLGFPVVQGGIIIPFPNHPRKLIYLLCEIMFGALDGGGVFTACRPLTYSIVDMNGNKGVVLDKKIPLTYDSLFNGQLTAVQHGNGRDWWVIGVPMTGSNRFHKFLADPYGISWDHVQIFGEPVNKGLGQAAISPDGIWFAMYDLAGVAPVNTFTEINLYRFDRCTGMLSDHIQVKDNGLGLHGGVAFSPNSRFMYTSHRDKIYQWDLAAADIVASRTLVAQYDGFVGHNNKPTHFYNMKLAPDGKIYISVPPGIYPSRYLHVIDQPDLKGPSCNVLQHSVLLPTFNRYTLPNHPVTRLGVMEGSPCDTLLSSSVAEPSVAEPGGWKVYPNPASAWLTLSCEKPHAAVAQWSLYDALGREARRASLPPGQTETLMSLEGLSRGLYFYRVEREGTLLHAGKMVVIE
jgi:hypothetical protein